MHQPKRCLPPWFTVTFACEVRLHPEQYGFLWKYTPTSNGWSSYSCIIRAPSRRPSPWRPTSVPRSRAHPDLALDGQMAWDRPADYQRGFNHPDMGTGLEKKNESCMIYDGIPSMATSPSWLILIHFRYLAPKKWSKFQLVTSILTWIAPSKMKWLTQKNSYLGIVYKIICSHINIYILCWVCHCPFAYHDIHQTLGLTTCIPLYPFKADMPPRGVRLAWAKVYEESLWF